MSKILRTRRLDSFPTDGLLLCSLFALTAAVSYCFYRANLGFSPLFGDDVYTVLRADLWLHGRAVLPYPGVPPMKHWLLALGLGIGKDLLSAPAVIGCLVFMATTAACFFLSRELFPGDRTAAFLASVLAAFQPAAMLRNGGSFIEESLYSLFALASAALYLRHLRTGRSLNLMGAALCVLAATLSRLDGFFFAGLFSLRLLLDKRRRPAGVNDSPPRLAAALTLAWAHLPVWLSFQDPFSFLRRESIQHLFNPAQIYFPLLQFRNVLPRAAFKFMISRLYLKHDLLVSAADPFLEVLTRFPLILAFCALWLFKDGRPRGPARRYLAFPAGLFLCLAPFYWASLVPPYCHYTHFVPMALLLAPLAGRGLSRTMSSFSPPGRAAAAGALSCALALNGLAAFPSAVQEASNYHPDMIRTSALLRDLRDDGSLPSSARVLFELPPRVNDPCAELQWSYSLPLLVAPPREAPDKRGRGLDDSDRITYDRDASWESIVPGSNGDDSARPTIFSLNPKTIGRILASSKVALVVARSPETSRKLRGFAREIPAFGPYHFLLPPPSPPGLDRAIRMRRIPLLQTPGVSAFRCSWSDYIKEDACSESPGC